MCRKTSNVLFAFVDEDDALKRGVTGDSCKLLSCAKGTFIQTAIVNQFVLQCSLRAENRCAATVFGQIVVDLMGIEPTTP